MTGDPTRDHEHTDKHFNEPDVPWTEDEYRDHQRREREREMKERMDAAHEKAKAEKPCSCWQQVTLHSEHCCFDGWPVGWIAEPGGSTPCGHTDPAGGRDD